MYIHKCLSNSLPNTLRRVRQKNGPDSCAQNPKKFRDSTFHFCIPKVALTEIGTSAIHKSKCF